MTISAQPGRTSPQPPAAARPGAVAVARRFVAALGTGRTRPRGSLRDLDPHLLRDIGLSASDVALERARR
jgi:uncharacterized protein YjiS (DUF1127 family)